MCVYCGGRSVVKRGWRELYRRYKCKDCGRWFNDKTGVVMAHLRLPLRGWFFTAFMLQSRVSVRELAGTLRRPYVTVFKMVRKIRKNTYLTTSIIKLKGNVKADEVYVKTGFKGKRTLKRKPRVRGLKRRGRGTYAEDALPILGVVERDGSVRLVPLADVATRMVLRRLFKSFDSKG